MRIAGMGGSFRPVAARVGATSVRQESADAVLIRRAPSDPTLHTPWGIYYAIFDTTPLPLCEVLMCSPATCYACGKTTWSGCGQHADMVMAGVPADARCTCQPEPAPPQPAHGAFGW